MKEFVLIFRNDPPATDAVRTPEQLQEISKPWLDWVGGIAAQDKLASRGARLDFEGASLKGGSVTDGPYAEVRAIVPMNL